MASRTRPPILGSKCRWILLSGWAPKGCQKGSVDLGSIIDPHTMKGENWPLQALLWLPHLTVTSSSLPKYGHILRWHCVPPKGTWFSVSQKWSVTWHGLPALGLWVQQWLYHSFFLWFCMGGWLGAGLRLWNSSRGNISCLFLFWAGSHVSQAVLRFVVWPGLPGTSAPPPSTTWVLGLQSCFTWC